MNNSAPRWFLAPTDRADSIKTGRQWYVFCACILLVTLLVDAFAPLGIAVPLLYSLAVAAAGMAPTVQLPWVVAAISTALTVLGFYWPPPGGIVWMGATNRALSIGSIWLTAWIVSQWKSTSRSHSHYHSVRLQSLLTHSQTLIFVKDLQGRFLEVSEQFLALIGVPAEEAIGKTDHDFFPHDLADLYREHDGQVVKAGEAMNFEEAALLGDDVRHYVVRKFPLRDEVGRIVAVGGVATDMTARLQAEADRHEAQERLDLVVAATQTGIWDWDLPTNTMYYSPLWKSSLGYEEDEISTSPCEWNSRLHPDDKDRAFALVESFLSGRVPAYELEHRLRHKDGTYRWIHTTAVLQRDAEGRPRRMTGSHLDITARKQASEALRQSESTLRSFFDSGVMMMGIVELCDGDIVHISDNRCVAGFFGTTPELMEGRRASELGVPMATIELWLRQYEESGRTKKPVRFEYVHADRTSLAEKRFSVTVCWIGSAPSGRGRYSYVAEDVTEARRIEAALSETAERYRGLVSALAEGVLLHDAQGLIVACNPSAERILGLTADQLMGKTPMDPHWQAVHADGRPFEDDLRPPVATLRTGQPCTDVIMGVCRPSGEQRWISINTQALKKPDDEHPYAVVSSFHDITDRRRAEQALLEAQTKLEQRVRERTVRIHQLEVQRSQAETLAALGQLAADIAHEVNNPLAGIKNAFHLVKQGIGSEHRHYRFVELIDREIQRLSAIVKKMYTLYQGGASRERQLTNFADLLQDVSALLDYRLSSRRIRLRTEVQVTRPAITLPRADLFQVLLNLVQNAIDASPADSEVVVKVVECADMLQWSVIDHGTGIAPGILPHIFDPFYTTKSAADRPGLGLGLCVSQRLVHEVGGRIEVQTELGAGSTFTVVHPLEGACVPAQ